MKFEIVGKALQLTAENGREVLELIQHYRLDTMQHVDAIAAGHLVHVAAPSASRDNGQWFACSYTAGPAFLAPYMARLKKVTGYAGPVPTIEPAPIYADWHHAPITVQHTHMETRATIDADGYHVAGFICSQDWNGKTAEQRYASQFAEYIQAGIGATRSEPEFIEIGNRGLLKRNPNYLRRYAPHAECTSVPIFGALLSHWYANYATQGQRETLDAALACHQTVCGNDTLASWLIREYQGLRTSWGNDGFVSFETFKGL